MDNPARTANFLARRDQRTTELRDALATLLAGRTRITLEIGSGHGHFLTAYAAAHPEEFCVGIDIIGERVGRARRKRDRAKLQNLEFLAAEAEEFVAALPPHVELGRIYILFPDPWPKRRHHKHRIMRVDFLAALAARAGRDAQLYFRTDDADYLAAARVVLHEHANWSPSDAPWRFEYTTVFQSRAPSFGSLVAKRRLQHAAEVNAKDSV